jgi:hypothetical protein
VLSKVSSYMDPLVKEETDIPLHSNNIKKEEGLKLGQTSTEHDHPACRALWSRQVKHENDKLQDRQEGGGEVPSKQLQLCRCMISLGNDSRSLVGDGGLSFRFRQQRTRYTRFRSAKKHSGLLPPSAKKEGQGITLTDLYSYCISATYDQSPYRS